MQLRDQVTSGTQSWSANVIEKGLLLLVAALPIWVNVWSPRTFEPAKAQFLRILTGLLVLVWLASRRSTGTISFKEAQPLLRVAVGLSVILGSILTMATLTSTAPTRSIGGSTYWQGGTITEACELALFMLAVLTFNRPAPMRRLLAVVVLGSLPVTLYALIQALNLDPFVWNSAYIGRAFSTLGNPNLLATYLAMVLPVTAAEATAETEKADIGSAGCARSSSGAGTAGNPFARWLPGDGSCPGLACSRAGGQHSAPEDSVSVVVTAAGHADWPTTIRAPQARLAWLCGRQP